MIIKGHFVHKVIIGCSLESLPGDFNSAQKDILNLSRVMRKPTFCFPT